MHTLMLPRLGQTMEAGTIVTWFVQEGQAYEVGDPLYEVETEKNQVEVEAKLPGTIARLAVAEDEQVPVGTLLAVVADPGEQLSDEQIQSALRAAPAQQEQVAPATAAAAAAPADGDQAAAGTAGRGRARAMPRAKRLAAELGIDLATVTGTGPDGTITEADVRQAGKQGVAVRERRPLRGIARAQAEQMTRSWQIPQFSQDVEVDVGNLRQRRATLRDEGVQVTVTDLVIDAVVGGVAKVPEVNSTFAGEEIVVYEPVNVSVAVATDAGLVVPVLHDCQAKSLEERAAGLAGIAERARAGALTPQDSTGGTITVSNLGMAGVETGVPLLNAPQACIVFAGATVDKPAVRDGQVTIRPMMHLVIAYDHRVLDGLTASRFTAAVREALEAA
jgi:pyruvate dehydrogenase E2 component (dihydrolipoamide acetyltransferase)